MRARLLSLAVAAGLVLVAGPLAGVAAGEERPPSGTGGYVDDQGDPSTMATDINAAPGGGGGGGGEAPPCTPWEVEIEDDFAFPLYNGATGERVYSETGRWLRRTCLYDTPTGETTDAYYVVPEGGEVDPEALALQALESVTVPAPGVRTSPPAGSLVVQVPTWLWVEGDWWRPYEATATAGRVSSTVSVHPLEASWSMGDGSTVTCSGPGVAWSPGAAEDATDCSHTYTATSDGEPGGTFDVSVTVELDVSWTSNGGASGTLPLITRTVSQPVRVGEIQAIETE